jgi:hypothetical protein
MRGIIMRQGRYPDACIDRVLGMRFIEHETRYPLASEELCKPVRSCCLARAEEALEKSEPGRDHICTLSVACFSNLTTQVQRCGAVCRARCNGG